MVLSHPRLVRQARDDAVYDAISSIPPLAKKDTDSGYQQRSWSEIITATRLYDMRRNDLKDHRYIIAGSASMLRWRINNAIIRRNYLCLNPKQSEEVQLPAHGSCPQTGWLHFYQCYYEIGMQTQ